MKKLKCSKKNIVYMVGILIFLIVAFYLRFKIASIYEDAIKSYKNKDYIVAIEKFESIGDYKDSYTYIENAKNEIKYQKALDYLEDDNYEEAIEMFEKIINYHDSKAKIKQAKYEWALFLYKNEQYLKAEQLFAELDSYSNSLLYKAKCSLKMIENDNKEVYEYASKLYGDGKYEEALNNFLQISEYKDSDKYINKCESHIRRLELATTICAGIRYSLAIDKNGKIIIASNENNNGFNFDKWEDVVSLSGMSYIILGLTSNGEVYETHLNDLPYTIDVSNWSDVIQIGVGDQFAVALKSDGKVYCDGRNYENQYEVKNWKNIIQISVSHRTIVGLDKQGKLHFAGYHSKELSLLYQDNEDKWKNVKYVEISGGNSSNEVGHVIGLTNDNGVVVIGDTFVSNKNKVEDLIDITSVSLGDNHILAINKENEILIVGNAGTVDYIGQDPKEKILNWPAKDIIMLSTSYNLSLALTKDGEVFAAGNDKQGQLLANRWKEVMVHK